MPGWVWIVIAVVVLALVALAVWLVWRRRRSERLRERFGPEYERATSDAGKRQAEAELEARERRREELEIRPLAPGARDRYLGSWRAIQERFVDEPGEAVGEADRLVSEVMRERGYPMDEFEQRAADISVDHPDVVENYRAAHAVYVKNGRGEATTEELRQATLHYRTLVGELLETDEEERKGVGARRAGGEEAGGDEDRPVVNEEVARVVRADEDRT